MDYIAWHQRIPSNTYVGEGNARGTSTINDALQQLVYYPPIGQQWAQRFLGRYPLLETKVSRQIE